MGVLSCYLDNIDFYPRSPCGERPIFLHPLVLILQFLSTLSLRRATSLLCLIFPLSPLFLSTLSLRRATPQGCYTLKEVSFLSTLSLRRATHYDNYNLHCVEISIHALLAESDLTIMLYDSSALIFLSTLSLRRATGA